MEIKTIKESLERLQLLVDKDITHVRPSDMDEFLSEWQQAMKDIRKALHQQEQAEPVGHFYNRPKEGRIGVEWCCDHLEDGSPLYRRPPSAAPKGYALVPIEPSQKMLDAGYWPCTQGRGSKSVWTAMLAAAPQPKETGE